MRRIILFSFLLFLWSFSLTTMAQDTKSAGGARLTDKTTQDFIMVGGMGVAGAILGLSTLSFAERPMENLKNITIGASLGIIIGVAMVAYNQATMTQENFNMAGSTYREVVEQSLTQEYFASDSSRDYFSERKSLKEFPYFYLSHIFSF